MEKRTGIWIDKRHAKIVTLINADEHFYIIESETEEFKPKGGSGTRLKGGPQDVVQDSKFTERQKQQQKRFFNDIFNYISDSDQVVIFGPAQTAEKLYAEIENTHPTFIERVKEVKPADSITDNQVRAWVRDYFSD